MLVPKEHVRELMARNEQVMEKLKGLIKEVSDSEKDWIFDRKLDLENMKQELRNQEEMHKELEKLEKQF